MEARVRDGLVATGCVVEEVVGVEAVRDLLGRLAETTHSEVMSVNPGGAQSAEALARARPLSEAALARGVRMRSIYLDSLRNDETTAEHVQWLGQRGAEVRTLPTVPLRMVVVDRREAVVAEGSRDGALRIVGDSLVDVLVALYESLWRSARPYDRCRPARGGAPLSIQERAAVELWARGCTDEVVASRLGVSLRTVRRMSQALTKRAGAMSRFDFGAKALALGWIQPEHLS